MLNKIGFLHLAKNVSKCSNHHHKIGCVLSNHKPFAIGFNIVKTSPWIANPDTSPRKAIHAELRAIKNSGRTSIKNGTAYVYRETRDGQPANAHPCVFCSEKLKNFGIKKIVFTISEPPFYQIEKL